MRSLNLAFDLIWRLASSYLSRRTVIFKFILISLSSLTVLFFQVKMSSVLDELLAHISAAFQPHDAAVHNLLEDFGVLARYLFGKEVRDILLLDVLFPTV